MIKPPILNPGDKVAVIAPASPFDPAALERGVEALRSLDLEPLFFESSVGPTQKAPEKNPCLPFLAQADDYRVNELHWAFAEESIKAIFCARGGYGTMRIVERLKPEIIRKCPKIFVGYSDLTTFLNLLTVNYSWVTFHGPVVAKDLDMQNRPRTLEYLKKALMSAEPLGELKGAMFNGIGSKCLSPGKARGILIGGNLSLLAATMGTPFEIQTDGKILFLEDIGERPYRVDRLLQQLRLAGKFQKVSGVVLGSFIAAPQVPGTVAQEGDSNENILERFFADLKVPVLSGFPAGHCEEKLTLPFGVQAVLNADEGILEISESGVQ